MVLGAAKNGGPIRFKVSLDGAASSENSGGDAAARGFRRDSGQRLYQLLQDRMFEIEFLNPGVQAFSFTFG